MPAVRYPGANWVGGRAAGYGLGRNRVNTVKAHYTVGRNSDAIGQNGYFQFLVSRDGTIRQYAEVDALCYDSGEWNDDGPGIEVEYYDEPAIFTDAARDACAGLVHWLHEEWGVPLEYYDGPRISEGSYSGFISHRSLIQTEQHSDYWPRADWDAMAGGDMPLTTDDIEKIAQRVVAYLANPATNPGTIVDPAARNTIAAVQTGLLDPVGGANHKLDELLARPVSTSSGGTTTGTPGPLTITLTGEATPT